MLIFAQLTTFLKAGFVRFYCKKFTSTPSNLIHLIWQKSLFSKSKNWITGQQELNTLNPGLFSIFAYTLFMNESSKLDKLSDISYIIFCTDEFFIWVKSLDRSLRIRIDQRIYRLQEGNPGLHKKFDKLLELKWKAGTMGSFRLYCFKQKKASIILLLGGHKGEQSRDITKTKKILKGVIDGKIRTQVYESIFR